jgi:hypothetical protein
MPSCSSSAARSSPPGRARSSTSVTRPLAAKALERWLGPTCRSGSTPSTAYWSRATPPACGARRAPPPDGWAGRVLAVLRALHGARRRDRLIESEESSRFPPLGTTAWVEPELAKRRCRAALATASWPSGCRTCRKDIPDGDKVIGGAAAVCDQGSVVARVAEWGGWPPPPPPLPESSPSRRSRRRPARRRDTASPRCRRARSRSHVGPAGLQGRRSGLRRRWR